MLSEVDGYLFSAGERSDYSPQAPALETTFEFYDRVRQPYFERQRTWWERAFAKFPPGADKRDLCQRFRSRKQGQHEGAAWELFQHELWSRLGWTLKPHPSIEASRRRDFLVERGDDRFVLECAVAMRGVEMSGTETARWNRVEHALGSMTQLNNGLIAHREAIGSNEFDVRRMVSDITRGIAERTDAFEGLIYRANTSDGWMFTVEVASWVSPQTSPVVASGGCFDMDKRYFDNLLRSAEKKASGSSSIGLPFVVAIQVKDPMPVVGVEGVVREALRRLWTRNGQPTRSGVSAFLVQQDLWPGASLPTVHINPWAAIPIDIRPQLATVTYTADERMALVSETTAPFPHEVFGVDPSWPGPDDIFEGVNTPNVLTPQNWSPSEAITSET